MKPDALIDEVRQARSAISRDCEHDVWRLLARYQRLQEAMKAEGVYRFVSEAPGPEALHAETASSQA